MNPPTPIGHDTPNGAQNVMTTLWLLAWITHNETKSKAQLQKYIKMHMNNFN